MEKGSAWRRSLEANNNDDSVYMPGGFGIVDCLKIAQEFSGCSGCPWAVSHLSFHFAFVSLVCFHSTFKFPVYLRLLTGRGVFVSEAYLKAVPGRLYVMADTEIKKIKNYKG